MAEARRSPGLYTLRSEVSRIDLPPSRAAGARYMLSAYEGAFPNVYAHFRPRLYSVNKLCYAEREVNQKGKNKRPDAP